MKGMVRNGCCRSAVAILLTFAMIIGSISVSRNIAEAASKPAFQKKKLTLAKGKTVKLKVKKLPKGAKVLKTKWKVQKKSVLKVTLSGSKAKRKKAKTAKVKALKAGKSAVYCTITYRVKKGGKWKKKSGKAKITITVPTGAKVTAAPQGPSKPSETGKPGANASGAPGNTGNPGDATNPGETTDPSNPTNPGGTTDPSNPTNPGDTTDPSNPTNPGGTTDPSNPTNPGGTTDPSNPTNPSGTANPSDPTNPGGTTDPSGTADPGEATAKPTVTPVPTPAITPNPDAKTYTWTGTMKSAQWDSVNETTIPGSYSQSSCSDGLTVSDEYSGCWRFRLDCKDWSQYQYPVLKCYQLESDSTTDSLEVWYGDDSEGKVTHPFAEWNAQGISLDKARVSQGVKIANRTTIGKIEICEGEVPAELETDVGSHDFSKTALEFSKELKIGWNLGNTLDGIINRGAFTAGNAGMAAESAYGNPRATENLIKAVKNAGFNTVRLPVTWTNHTDPNNDYKIDEAWMNRIEEVVRYCTRNGMHVILNVHHDGNDDPAGSDENGNPTGSNSWLTPDPADEAAKAEMKVRYQKIWTQIATRFKDYSNLVLFSSMNEFHHRYDAPSDAYYNLQNELHQIFVDTVRGTGGNNARRYLILPGYNTNIDQAISGLKLPTDTIEKHLMVEVHYYDPYTFSTENHTTDQWGYDYAGAEVPDRREDGYEERKLQEKYLISQMQKMKTNFVEKGIPVVIGEFGAEARKDSVNEKFRRYYLQYVVKYATEYGLVPVYWDDGTNYQLINRNTYEIAKPDLVNGMMDALKPGYSIPLPQ